MKLLAKISLLLVMIGLLSIAFVLPKFVQRAEPPTAEEDLAAALAAVELDEEMAEEPESPSPAREQVESSLLREEERFSEFFSALDEEEFEKASEELVVLSGEIDSETMEELTQQMEMSVASISRQADAMDDPVGPTIPDATPKEPEAPDEKPATVAPDADGSTEMITFFTTVQSGDFAKAEEMLDEWSGNPETKAVLQTTFDNAKLKSQELEESRKQLAQSREQMSQLQQESVAQIKESVKELAEITKAAREATAEANRLRETVAQSEAKGAAKETDADEPDPVTIPDPISVAFGFDSTFLSDSAKDSLTEAVTALESEKRLKVQLRGYADASGPSDYNGILAQARCEIVKDFLLESSIGSDRITIVSFGETQAGSSGQSEEDLRRVDVIFREN